MTKPLGNTIGCSSVNCRSFYYSITWQQRGKESGKKNPEKQKQLCHTYSQYTLGDISTYTLNTNITVTKSDQILEIGGHTNNNCNYNHYLLCLSPCQVLSLTFYIISFDPHKKRMRVYYQYFLLADEETGRLGNFTWQKMKELKSNSKQSGSTIQWQDYQC